MRKLDFETNVIKNPISGDDPGTNLARRWRNKVYYLGSWWRCYWFFVLSVICLAGMYAWYYLTYDTGNWDKPGSLELLALKILVLIFIVLRLQAGSLPALIAAADTKESLWQHFRMTLISGDDVARAMFFTSLNLAAAPLALLTSFMSILYIDIIDSMHNFMDFVVFLPLFFVVYLFIALIISALGLIGALIWRSVVGVGLAIIVPAFLMLMSAGLHSIRDLWGNMGTYWLLADTNTHPVFLFTLIENKILTSGSTLSRHGFTVAASIDLEQSLRYVIWLGVVTAIIWIALWLVLKFRLKRG